MNNNNMYNRMAGEYKQKMNPVTVSVAVREASTATVEVTIAGTTTTTTTTRGPEQTTLEENKGGSDSSTYPSKKERWTMGETQEAVNTDTLVTTPTL